MSIEKTISSCRQSFYVAPKGIFMFVKPFLKSVYVICFLKFISGFLCCYSPRFIMFFFIIRDMIIISDSSVLCFACFGICQSVSICKAESASSSYRNFHKLQKRVIVEKGQICYNPDMGNHRAKGGFTPLIFRRVQSSPPNERKEGDAMYVTYADLIQIGIFIVALANLIYQIYKGKKKQPPLLQQRRLTS